jgi:N-ethylmaleimide reductase
MREVFSGRIGLNSDYRKASAEAKLAEGIADFISFGRPFIANPDLVERFRRDEPLARWDTDTFYTPGPRGYVDYPTLKEQAAA